MAELGEQEMVNDIKGRNQGVPPGTTEYCVIVTETRSKVIRVRRPSPADGSAFASNDEQHWARQDAVKDTETPWRPTEVRASVSHWINGGSRF